MVFASYSVNQRLASGPDVIEKGSWWRLPESRNSVISPVGVICPILFPLYSVNHKFPSGPAVMPAGLAVGVGIKNLVTVPEVVMRSIVGPPAVNQRFPSGPAVILANDVTVEGAGNSVIVPDGVISPILPLSVNHRFPPGPAVIPTGPLEPAGRVNSPSMTPFGVIRPIWFS